MAAITLDEILEHVEQFERVLQDFYEKLSEDTTHEGVRLLTEYMSRHSQRIGGLMEDLSSDTKKRSVQPPCLTGLSIRESIVLN